MQYMDYYRILDVEEDATEAQIKAAYRRLARRYHPDVSNMQDAEERFKEIAEAYDTLKDPDRRIAYDRFGSCRADACRPPPDWERQFGDFFGGDEGASGGCDPGDLFDLFKRGTARGSSRGFAHSPEIEITVQITLEQAARGAELELELPPANVNGSTCETRTARVRIPAGARHGQVLHVPRAGAEDDAAAGELHVTIVLRPHPLFRVDGHDLTLDLPLTPWEAALGAALEVPTLDGHVKLRVPPGTQANQKLRLTGLGLPKPGGGAGDLYARIEVVTPSVLSERERELYAELARASRFEPRGHFA